MRKIGFAMQELRDSDLLTLFILPWRNRFRIMVKIGLSSPCWRPRRRRGANSKAEPLLIQFAESFEPTTIRPEIEDTMPRGPMEPQVGQPAV
ncbi:MAG TPA: hypothetical protein VGJ15_08700, partial [Pirellulales bacterium]